MSKQMDLKSFLDALSKNMSDEDLLFTEVESKISSAIKSKRLSMGMTQDEFSSFLGVSQSKVSQWENGESNFTLKSLASLACKLHMFFSVDFRPEPPNSFSLSNTRSGFNNSNVIAFPASTAANHRFAASFSNSDYQYKTSGNDSFTAKEG